MESKNNKTKTRDNSNYNDNPTNPTSFGKSVMRDLNENDIYVNEEEECHKDVNTPRSISGHSSASIKADNNGNFLIKFCNNKLNIDGRSKMSYNINYNKEEEYPGNAEEDKSVEEHFEGKIT